MRVGDLITSDDDGSVEAGPGPSCSTSITITISGISITITISIGGISITIDIAESRPAGENGNGVERGGVGAASLCVLYISTQSDHYPLERGRLRHPVRYRCSYRWQMHMPWTLERAHRCGEDAKR
jgi:hypothetical protein